MSSNQMSPDFFEYEETSKVSLFLTRKLIESTSLNDYMESVFPRIGSFFGTSKMSLVDYYEHTNHFDLIYFEGYSADSRYGLQRRLPEMEVETALQKRDPFHSSANPKLLCVPFYFREILEAVLVFEGDAVLGLSPARMEIARLLSRFLGLFMSSTRLAVNREQLVDMTDLQRARQIQLNFLPRAYPRRSTCEIYGYNNSSNLVGGDYFDFFDDRPDSFQCILADACGHGLAAALIMSNFRGLLKSEIVQHESFSGLFNQLNFLLHFDDELIQYLTGVFLNYDPSTGALEYLNAGHYDPLVITKDGTLRSLTGGGPPLGMFKGSTYPLGNTVLELGDLVVLYTDGLVDVQNGDGDYFGSGGITRTVLRYRGIALDQIADEVIQQAGEFAGSSDFEDDVTIFLFKVK